MPNPASNRSTAVRLWRPASERLWRVAPWLLVPFLVLGPLALAGAAQDDTTGDEPATDAPAADEEGAEEGSVGGVPDETLILGAEVYTAVCSACHQPGGVGLSGQFPPLKDNPNVMDAAYVADVIANGRQGEVVVNGETYDGRMPAFSTLPEDEVDAVIAYIQADFAAPSNAAAAVEPSGPVAGTELPGLAGMSSIVAYLIAIGVAVLVLAPRITSAGDGLSMPWFDAWLKTAIIVVGFVLFTVFVPSWILQTETVSGLDRIAQDVIGAGLWFMALAAGIWGLWYASRERRI